MFAPLACNPTASRRCRAGLAVLVLAATAATGCQERRISLDGRPLPPEPRALGPAPDSALANRMTLLHANKPIDSNGNGFPDLIHITTALFDATLPGSPSLEARGDFIFTLYRMGEVYDDDVQPIAEWRFDAARLEQHRAAALYGVCYQFELNLLAAGSDRLPATNADLRGRYEPLAAGAEPVLTSDEVRYIQLGRTGYRSSSRRTPPPNDASR